MTQGREPGRDDDWGVPTDWQHEQPPPHGGTGQPPGGGFQGPQQQFPPAPPWAPGPPSGWPGGPPRPLRTYMVPAVLSTLLCFLPTGIAAIVYASQVASKQQVGDYAGALAASQKAKTWVIVTVVLGLIVDIIVIASLSSSGSSYYY
jgi:hypothetical protein